VHVYFEYICLMFARSCKRGITPCYIVVNSVKEREIEAQSTCKSICMNTICGDMHH